MSLRDLRVAARRTFDLGAVAGRLAVLELVDLVSRRGGRRARRAERLRRALERLGVAYVKFGQYIAVRHDVFPEDLCREMGRLFERASVVEREDLRPVIEKELGAPVEDCFDSFDWTPVAAASIAQVHEARTRDGRRVAVKVQRPGVESVFEADIRNLERLGRMLDRVGVLGTISIRELVEEFARFTRDELDFLTEGRTADRLRSGATEGVTVPRILWEQSTRRVLVMEFVEGTSVSRLLEILQQGGEEAVRLRYPDFELPAFLDRLTEECLHQIFGTGFFHGDPHPGNVILQPGNRAAFVDFGIFGRLTEGQRETFLGYAEQVVVGNIDEGFRYLERIYHPSKGSDELAFSRDVRQTLRRWYRHSMDPTTPLRLRHFGTLFSDLVPVVTRHRYRASVDTLLLWRALIVLDSILHRLDPEFDLIARCRGYFAAHRPSVSERFRMLALDPIAAHRHIDLAGEAPERLLELLRRTSGRPTGRSMAVATRDAPARRRRAERLIAAAAVAVGAVISSWSAAYEPMLGTLLLGAGVAAVFALAR